VRDFQDSYWEPEPETPRWAIAIAALILVAGAVSATAIYLSRQDDGTKAVARSQPRQAAAKQRDQSLPSQEKQTRAVAPPPEKQQSSGSGGAILGPDAQSSFEALAATLSAQVGLAVASLGDRRVHEFGSLREGHAWSSIKVPILTAVMRDQGEALDAEEEAWASSALTASDNEAAAALFGRLEDTHGGLSGASAAVEGVLRQAGDATTTVATAPPPPGAVSTYGQTDWSLLGSVQFYGSLADGCLLGPSGTEYVTGLMEQVISEQRWGLGEAGFPSGWGVGMKGGWGPEASGAYLVRQSGFVRDGDRGIAVAMIAIDDSGSYPAGAADLTQMAQWLAGELQGLGPPASGC
jgi:beta-lactamase class A